MTRYYVDTEFIDDGHTIDLISVGIVCEDGRELYLQSCEFASETASDWVRENVYSHLSYCSYMEGKIKVTGLGAALLAKVHHRYFLEDGPCPVPGCQWRTRERIRDEVRLFLDPAQHGKPELWGYYSAYDHVVFCQLFGPMVDLPKGYPMYTRDIQQAIDERGIVDLPPQPENEHNALADARWIKAAWERIYCWERFGGNNA